ncbi:MAG: sensor histidine kinase [Acidimicrobiia bacterium]|nr:sensor histidine kinase [Acidimicrobiia bacterium]
MRDIGPRAREVWRARPLLTDTVLMLVLLSTALVDLLLYLRVDRLSGRPNAIPTWLAITWTVGLHVPLAGRRRWPLASFAIISAVFAGYRLWLVPEPTISALTLFLSMASVGAHGRAPRRDWLRAVSMALMAFSLVVNVVAQEIPAELESAVRLSLIYNIGFNVVFFVAAWLIGDAMRHRLEREAALVERAEQFEWEREENARRAVVDERVRIARELHDVVAHHVSVMGVQAGAARRVLDRRPDRAAEALAVVEASSRQAVDELRRLVGFLRTELDGGGRAADSLAPQPGLARLGDLVTESRTGGLDVHLHLDGEPGTVPDSVELSAYRIVQEALTNTRKHARATAAEVTVRYRADRLEIEVDDDGHAALAASQHEEGHGLVGMRERVTLHGGTLEAGPRAQGGFRVAARFPLRGAA